MCQHRFGVLNDMYLELVDEGITDVKIMGINGRQYNHDDEMINGRILPWAQDTLTYLAEEYNIDDYGSENSAASACIGAGYTWNSYDDYCFAPYVWDLWDVSLRDLFILDRSGVLFARINLTPNNPDPESNCGNNYQIIKDLILSARER